MPQTVTVEQLYRFENILKAYSKLAAPGTAMQDFYGMGPGAPARRCPIDTFAGDIFNNSRLIAHGRAADAPPGTVKRKPSGQFTGKLMRLHEKMPITDASIWNYRPIGSPVGTLDAGGKRAVSLQMRYLLQRFRNAREFCVSRMFRGGWGFRADGDDLILTEKGAGDFDVNTQVPASNLTTVGGIFPVNSWNTTTTDIPEQFLNLGKLAERVYGQPSTIAWLNSSGYAKIMQNSKIASYRGTANRVFDLQSGRMINTVPEGRRKSGYAVKFDVMPQMTFIVYDGVLNVDKFVDSSEAADCSLFIPDGKMIVTPAPAMGDWHDMAEGGEPVREHKADQSATWRWGFYTWQEPTTQPSGREIICLDKFLPFLPVPQAVYYVDIYTP